MRKQINERFSPESVRDRSLAIKRDLDAAARSKAAKKMLDDANRIKKERVMKEEFAPIGDMISLIANHQPGEATGIINDLLNARVLDSLQSRKQDIAKNLFAPDPGSSLSEETRLSKADKAGIQKERESLRRKGGYLGAAKFNYFLNKTKKSLKEEQLDERNWIAGAIKHPGALHRALHVPQGEKIPADKLEAAAHKKGKVGKEARLAQTLKGLHEEIVQEEHESVEDFIKRGGKVKHVPAHKAHGAQKKQTIKVPFRMGKSAR
jgi:hypothetical protein